MQSLTSWKMQGMPACAWTNHPRTMFTLGASNGELFRRASDGLIDQSRCHWGLESVLGKPGPDEAEASQPWGG